MRNPYFTPWLRNRVVRFLHEDVKDSLRDMDEHLVDFLCLPPRSLTCPEMPTIWFATQKMLLFDSASEGIPFAKSVLTVARRYEAPPDDELVGQVARKVGAGASDKILKVGTVWMLSCLAGMLIFMPPSLYVHLDLLTTCDQTLSSL